MEAHSQLVLFHILLLVFWLGTDLGVFVAAKMSERSDLSNETRMTLMQLGMVLDRLPRTALILILPSGLGLASNLQLIALPAAALPVIWVLAFVWAAIMWMGFLNLESKYEKFSHVFNFATQCLLIVVLGYFVYQMWGTAPFWLSGKLLVLTLVFVCGVGLDLTFKPAVDAFKDIMINGATAERDALYRKTIAPVYWWVIAIYVLVIAAAYFGVVKPT